MFLFCALPCALGAGQGGCVCSRGFRLCGIPQPVHTHPRRHKIFAVQGVAAYRVLWNDRKGKAFHTRKAAGGLMKINACGCLYALYIAAIGREVAIGF